MLAMMLLGACKFSRLVKYIAVGCNGPPYVLVYGWSASGFGTKFSDPATQPSSLGYGVSFSSDGGHIAVASAGSPYILVYPWSGSGFGTKLANPVRRFHACK